MVWYREVPKMRATRREKLKRKTTMADTRSSRMAAKTKWRRRMERREGSRRYNGEYV
jgi:hypothetical protein